MVKGRNASSIAARTTGPLRTRSSLLAKPGACTDSPNAGANLAQSPSDPTAICTTPSAEWKSPYGQIEG